MEKNTVLFVDDEPNILNSLKRGLIDEDYRCIFVESGAKALEIIEKEDISVIVTDMKMPGMNGLELLKKIKEKKPNIVRIVLSGYTQLPQVLAAVNQGDIYKFLTKPWNLEDEFIPMLRSAIEHYNLINKNEAYKEELKTKNEAYRNIIESTQQKYVLFQEEIKNISYVSAIIFKGLKAYIAQGKLTNLNIIDFYEELHQNYLKTFPTKKINFNIKKLIVSLNNEFSTDKIKVNLEKEYFFYGNYNFLYFILTSTLKFLLIIDNQNYILDITANESNNPTKIFFTINNIRKRGITEDININIINNIMNILNGILNTFEGSLKFKEYEENYVVILSIDFKNR